MTDKTNTITMVQIFTNPYFGMRTDLNKEHFAATYVFANRKKAIQWVKNTYGTNYVMHKNYKNMLFDGTTTNMFYPDSKDHESIYIYDDIIR